MKKENVSSIVVYLLMIGLALFIGLGIIKPVFAANPAVPMNQYGFAILAVLLGIVLNAILLELGHVLGALFGKNKIVSVNVFGVSFNFQNKSKKVELKNFEGLTGETKFAPKSELSNPKFSILMPLLIYVVELAAAILLYALITKNNEIDLVWLSIGSIIVASIGGMMTLYNILPFRLDAETDGYRLMLFSKKVNVQAFNLVKQFELKEVTEELPMFEEITDYTALVHLLSACKLIEKDEYEKAEEILNVILEQKDKISTVTHSYVFAQLLFIKAMTNSLEEFRNFYREVSAELGKFFATDLSTYSVRAYLLVCGLVEESEGEVLHALEKMKKAMKHTAFGLIQLEEHLTEKALDKILEIQPNWKLK